MIVKIKVEILKNKHDYNGLADTEMSIDSDKIDPSTVAILAQGLVESALARAFSKPAEPNVGEVALPVPPPPEIL